MKRFPLQPAHPERTCWGCDRYCAADSMICGNGTERTQHPTELFGPGWERSGLDPYRPAAAPGAGSASLTGAGLSELDTLTPGEEL